MSVWRSSYLKSGKKTKQCVDNLIDEDKFRPYFQRAVST